jgi:hypothetical protein
MTVSNILIFCFIVSGQQKSYLYCCESLVVVAWICSFHFREVDIWFILMQDWNRSVMEVDVKGLEMIFEFLWVHFGFI